MLIRSYLPLKKISKAVYHARNRPLAQSSRKAKLGQCLPLRCLFDTRAASSRTLHWTCQGNTSRIALVFLQICARCQDPVSREVRCF